MPCAGLSIYTVFLIVLKKAVEGFSKVDEIRVSILLQVYIKLFDIFL